MVIMLLMIVTNVSLGFRITLKSYVGYGDGKADGDDGDDDVGDVT